MQFSGFWVSQSEQDVIVTRTAFDETDLSDTSNWTEAWQNEDPTHPHGFIDPLAMLQDVCVQLVGELIESDRAEVSASLSSTDGCVIRSIEDLARLIQCCAPSKVTHTSAPEVLEIS